MYIINVAYYSISGNTVTCIENVIKKYIYQNETHTGCVSRKLILCLVILLSEFFKFIYLSFE